jgi:hypothetical protein
MSQHKRLKNDTKNKYCSNILFMNLPFMGNIPRLLVIKIDGKEEFEVDL